MVLRPMEGRNINVQTILRNLSSISGNDSSGANENSNNPNTSSNDAHNRALVQMRDYESFLIGLLHPQPIQSDYFALRAFHVELASIQAKESSVASMRMSWWLDVIYSLYDSGKNAGQNQSSESAGALLSGNPTVAGLKTAIESHKLTKRFFERMVETRINDVERTSNGQFNDVKDMILFFERTNSTFLFLDLECCGIIDEKADAVANSVGIATGIVNSIRSIGYGNVGIPNDLMVKYDIRQNDITDPRSLISASSKGGDIDGDNENINTGSNDNSDLERRQAVQNAVRDMSIVAGKYLQHARKHQAHVPKEGKSAMLPAVSALRYLERLESTNYDVMEEKIRDVENMKSLDGRLWRLGQMMYLGRAWLTGVF